MYGQYDRKKREQCYRVSCTLALGGVLHWETQPTHIPVSVVADEWGVLIVKELFTIG